MTGPRGTLKKLINDPREIVDEFVEAFVSAHAGIVRLTAPRVVARAERSEAKVGLAVGGGSGHEPAFIGYVGHGMADSAAVGNVFAAPGPDVVLESIRAADHGCGVVLLYGNYSGDVLNCRLAIERAAREGIDVRAVYVTDDVASAPRDERDRRRGIAGDILVFKLVGAAAEAGLALDDVERVARKANDATGSMGVALTGAELPDSSRPIFESGPHEMDVGLGIHGEPGLSREPLGSADDVGRLLADRVVDDIECEGDRVAVLVNGLGATTAIEQHLVYRSARAAIEDRGCQIERSFVGEYITALQMAGVSVTVTVLDDELLGLLDAPALSVGLVR